MIVCTETRNNEKLRHGLKRRLTSEEHWSLDLTVHAGWLRAASNSDPGAQTQSSGLCEHCIVPYSQHTHTYIYLKIKRKALQKDR